MVPDELIVFIMVANRGDLWALQGLNKNCSELRHWVKSLLDCAEVEPIGESDCAKWLLALTIRELADYFGRTPEGEEYLETPGVIEFVQAASLEEVRDAVLEVQDAVKQLEKVCLRMRLPRRPPKGGITNDGGPALPGCEDLHNHKLDRINAGGMSNDVLYGDDDPRGRPFMGETTMAGMLWHLRFFSRTPMGPASLKDPESRPLKKVLDRALDAISDRLADMPPPKNMRGKARPAANRMFCGNRLASLLHIIVEQSPTKVHQARFVQRALSAVWGDSDGKIPGIRAIQGWFRPGDQYHGWKTPEEWRRLAAGMQLGSRSKVKGLPPLEDVLSIQQ